MPLPAAVVTTGMSKRSANSRSSALALASRTPLPDTRTGRVPARTSSAARPTTAFSGGGVLDYQQPAEGHSCGEFSGLGNLRPSARLWITTATGPGSPVVACLTAGWVSCTACARIECHECPLDDRLKSRREIIPAVGRHPVLVGTVVSSARALRRIDEQHHRAAAEMRLHDPDPGISQDPGALAHGDRGPSREAAVRLTGRRRVTPPAPGRCPLPAGRAMRRTPGSYVRQVSVDDWRRHVGDESGDAFASRRPLAVFGAHAVSSRSRCLSGVGHGTEPPSTGMRAPVT